MYVPQDLNNFTKLFLELNRSYYKQKTKAAIIRQSLLRLKGTHNADSIMESKVIYYLEQCGLGV